MPSHLKGPCSQGNIREILITTTRQNYSPNMTRPKSTTSQQLWSITQFFSAFSKENIFQMVLVRNRIYTQVRKREGGGVYIMYQIEKPNKIPSKYLSFSFIPSLHASQCLFLFPSFSPSFYLALPMSKTCIVHQPYVVILI